MSSGRRTRTALCLIPMAALMAACGSSNKTSASKPPPSTASSGQSASPTAPSASSPTTAGSSAPTGTAGAPVPIVTPDGNHYTIKVDVGSASSGTKPPCAVAATSGRQTVPFTLTIANQSGKDAPTPAIGLLVDDAQKLGTELAAMSVDNSCIDFTLTGDTIKAGASVSYSGSVSNASANARLIINMKAGTIGSGATQEAFALK